MKKISQKILSSALVLVFMLSSATLSFGQDFTLVQERNYTAVLAVDIPEIEGFEITFTNAFGFYDALQQSLNPATWSGMDVEFWYTFNVAADSIMFSQEVTLWRWNVNEIAETVVPASTAFVPYSPNWHSYEISFTMDTEWGEWTFGGITLNNLNYESRRNDGSPHFGGLDIFRWDYMRGYWEDGRFIAGGVFYFGEWVLLPQTPGTVMTNAAPSGWNLGRSLLDFDRYIIRTHLDTASDWARSDIERAMELGVLPAGLGLRGGYSNMAITRQEFATLAVVLYELQRGEITGRVSFEDTTNIFVEKAAYINIVSGVGEGMFDPWGLLTREQAAAMLSRLMYALGHPIPAHNPTFNDNSEISGWATGVVGQMQQSGIMTGSEGNFNPQGQYTREMSIITLLRVFDRVNQ